MTRDLLRRCGILHTSAPNSHGEATLLSLEELCSFTHRPQGDILALRVPRAGRSRRSFAAKCNERVSTPSLASLKPQAWRSMCGCTGKPKPAATPSRAIIFRKPAGVNGAPRSDVKMNGDAVDCYMRRIPHDTPALQLLTGYINNAQNGDGIVGPSCSTGPNLE